MEQTAASSLLCPTDTDGVQEAVLQAIEAETPLAVEGAGTKRGYGRSVNAAATLSVAGISGVVDYQPEELILVVRPGTALQAVEDILAESGQMLAFEPPQWDVRATIGGVVGCNLSGPRRFKAGAARDHLLGFKGVSGRGEVIHGGGRVVKNVTGYDISKLMCGSFGSLVVMTELCFKVLPRPVSQRTVVIPGLTDDEGVQAMIAAVRSPHEVSGLAHLSPGCVLPPEVAGIVGSHPSLTMIRLEGPPASLRTRCDQLIGILGNQTVYVEDGESGSLWDGIRELTPLPEAYGTALWRFSQPATRAALLGVEVRRLAESAVLLFDWGGGLLWALLPGEVDAGKLHDLARENEGHARLVRSDPPLAPETPAFTPLTPGQALLNRNLKSAFDPLGILNPGRLYPDW